MNRKYSRPYFITGEKKVSKCHTPVKVDRRKNERKYNFDFSLLDPIEYEDMIKYLHRFSFSKFGYIDEDIIMNSLEAAFGYATKYDPNVSTKKTWISTIFINEMRMAHRKKKRYNYLYLDEDRDIKMELVYQEDEPDETQFAYIVLEDVKSGKYPYLYDFIINKLEYKDIAIKHNRPLGTIKSCISSERVKLKEKYKNERKNYKEG
jgi:DNA-directed RNA polymerase specialized sigma24 family protein